MFDEENKNPPEKPHYVYVKPSQPRQNVQKDQKDPDIWDPPSPKGMKKPAKKVCESERQ